MPHYFVFNPGSGTASFVQQCVFVSSAGIFSIIALVYMKTNIAFDGNNMHFLNEIDLAAAEGLDASRDLFVFLVSATF